MQAEWQRSFAALPSPRSVASSAGRDQANPAEPDQNKRFVQMFLDEARLALHLQHTNIVLVYDVGSSKRAMTPPTSW